MAENRPKPSASHQNLGAANGEKMEHFRRFTHFVPIISSAQNQPHTFGIP